MKRTICSLVLLFSLNVLSGCNKLSSILGTGSSDNGVSGSKNGILYTLTVSKQTLSILDTLTMTVTAKNQSDTSVTIYSSDYDYKWTLKNSHGDTIAYGPTVFSNLTRIIPLKPNESTVLYEVRYSMADLFSSSIQTGSYPLIWKLSNGLSFQIDLACEGQSAGSGIASPIYPLKVGNEWTFLQIYSFHGTILGTDTVTEEIVGQKVIRGETWYLLKSTNWVDQYITARQDGIYKYFTDLDTAVLLYKYPASMGDSYNSGYDSYTGYDDKDTVLALPMTVDSTNVTLSVPAGQYQCYKYTQPEDASTSRGVTTIIPSAEAYLSSIGPVARGNAGGPISEVLLSINFK